MVSRQFDLLQTLRLTFCGRNTEFSIPRIIHASLHVVLSFVFTSTSRWPSTRCHPRSQVSLFILKNIDSWSLYLNELPTSRSDLVLFHCHKSLLLAQSSNSFGHIFAVPLNIPSSAGSLSYPQHHTSLSTNFLGVPSSSEFLHSSSGPSPGEPDLLTIMVQESSVVLNVILHIAYAM